MLKNSACVCAILYANQGLFDPRANGCLRGWGGCGCTLNGKPALPCAVVMGGDYLGMQKDWMNAPPQIGRTLSLLPSNLPHSRCLLLISSRECFNHTVKEAEGRFAAGWFFFLLACDLSLRKVVIWFCTHCSCVINTLNSPALICTSSSSDVILLVWISHILALNATDYDLLLSAHGQCHCVDRLSNV